MLNASKLTRVYDYDILVVALGFVSETFGIEGMKDYAFQIENVLTSRKLSRHIEDKFANYAASKEKMIKIYQS